MNDQLIQQKEIITNNLKTKEELQQIKKEYNINLENMNKNYIQRMKDNATKFLQKEKFYKKQIDTM